MLEAFEGKISKEVPSMSFKIIILERVVDKESMRGERQIADSNSSHKEDISL